MSDLNDKYMNCVKQGDEQQQWYNTFEKCLNDRINTELGVCDANTEFKKCIDNISFTKDQSGNIIIGYTIPKYVSQCVDSVNKNVETIVSCNPITRTKFRKFNKEKKLTIK